MTRQVIFKSGDDLRQDQLIMQMISLMDSLLKRVNLDLRSVCVNSQLPTLNSRDINGQASKQNDSYITFSQLPHRFRFDFEPRRPRATRWWRELVPDRLHGRRKRPHRLMTKSTP